MPEGLREHDPFRAPIITPSTKAENGAHDEDISREEILARGIVDAADYEVLEEYTRELFKKGQEMAEERGLILVDTKYEFGKTKDGEILLIDEVHTPDSSRYFHLDGFQERQDRDEPQEQLSKEFVREWLIANDFQGKDGQDIPEMSVDFTLQIGERYKSLYEQLTGRAFIPEPTENIKERIASSFRLFLSQNPRP